jgi:hypothetical protein
MNATNILIFLMALSGFLPLVVFLYNKRRTDRILSNGRTTQGLVYDKQRSVKRAYEIVYYSFRAPDGTPHKGRLTTRPGKYRRTDSIEVYFLPEDPRQHTVKGNFTSHWFLVFVVLIAVFVLYGAYRLYRQVNGGEN